MPRIPILIELMRPFKGLSGVKATFHAEVTKRCEPQESPIAALAAANELSAKYFTDIRNDVFRVRQFLNWCDKEFVKVKSMKFQKHFLEIVEAMDRIEEFSRYSNSDIVLGETVTKHTNDQG